METGLQRDLGLFATTAIAIGAMVGSAIFILPGIVYAAAGPAVALVYVERMMGPLPEPLPASATGSCCRSRAHSRSNLLTDVRELHEIKTVWKGRNTMKLMLVQSLTTTVAGTLLKDVKRIGQFTKTLNRNTPEERVYQCPVCGCTYDSKDTSCEECWSNRLVRQS